LLISRAGKEAGFEGVSTFFGSSAFLGVENPKPEKEGFSGVAVAAAPDEALERGKLTGAGIDEAAG
jgi:hypothetical protein